jgi:hypothetical protein
MKPPAPPLKERVWNLEVRIFGTTNMIVPICDIVRRILISGEVVRETRYEQAKISYLLAGVRSQIYNVIAPGYNAVPPSSVVVVVNPGNIRMPLLHYERRTRDEILNVVRVL